MKALTDFIEQVYLGDQSPRAQLMVLAFLRTWVSEKCGELEHRQNLQELEERFLAGDLKTIGGVEPTQEEIQDCLAYIKLKRDGGSEIDFRVMPRFMTKMQGRAW